MHAPALRLPPLFQPVAAAGPAFDAACARAAAGAEPGTLVWTDRGGRLDCAIVLAPDRPLAQTRLITRVVLLALGDALAVLGPPRVAVSFAAPDRVQVNGADAGGARFAAPAIADDGIPDWAVVGVTVEVLGNPQDDSPGRAPDRTALREEGFGELTPADLLESMARHLLSWLDVWETEGDRPIERAWNRASNGGGGDGRR